ncbi:MAG TPA: glycine betaine ABC transporter substrate-binding protein [Thermomicrobiales bacterium]|jgi:glycine betaine/choline ABC-type transport system substrate-binding protein|nr:glycine betaine ABC transporter substrate-binding protein [Thermomicrobiales bacterium]
MTRLNRRQVVIGGSTAALAAAVLGRPTGIMAQDTPTIRVGSKPFTESTILGEVIGQLMEDAGYPVERKLDLGGTAVVHEGMVQDELDVYVEYTGTALLAILGRELPESSGDEASAEASPAADEIAGKDEVYNIVADAYPDEFGIVWLEPWGMNNTYSIAVRRETADELGLVTMSDLAEHAGDMTLGTDNEFPVRQDGLPGYQETYGYEFGDVRQGDIGLMYSALAEGDVDVITSYATDGRIPALDLVLLEDDKNFFPPYYGAPVVRQDLLEEAPEVEDILNQLAGKIDNDTMARFNARVDDDGVEPAEAARELLEEQGLIGSGE